MKPKIFLAVISYAQIGITFSQIPNEPDNIDKYSNLLEADSEEVDPYELTLLQKQRININSSQLTLLVDKGIVSEKEYDQIVFHQKKFGPILCLEELQVSIEDLNILKNLSQFIAFESRSNQQYSASHKSGILTRFSRVIQKSKGLTTGKYANTPWYQLYKIKLSVTNKITMGCTLENDIGEPFWSGINVHRFDFQSFYVSYFDVSKKRQFILGDYGLKIGQGLVLNTAFTTGETLESHSILGLSRKLSPYTSANESNLLRGMAYKQELGRLTYYGFVSLMGRDFTLNEDGSYFSSLSSTGLHRTTSEQSKTRQVKEVLLGTTVQYNLQGFSMGSTFTNHQFSHYYRSNQQSNIHQVLMSKSFTKMGMDLMFEQKNHSIFVEVAYDDVSKSFNYLAGIIIALSRRFSTGIGFLRYAPTFFTYQSNAIGNNSSNNNEQSYIWKCSITLNQWKIHLNMDLCHTPHIHSKNNISFQKVRQTVQFEQVRKRKFEWYVRIRRQVEHRFETISNLNKLSARVHLRTFLNQRMSVAYRIEGIQVQEKSKYNGTLAYVEFSNQWKRNRIKFKLRICRFQSDEFASRIWAYESSVPLLFESPAFYDHGIRVYTIISYSRIRNVSLSLKLARTAWFHKSSVGSGNDEITGHEKHRLTLQAQYKW